jgi:hypothetical protein
MALLGRVQPDARIWVGWPLGSATTSYFSQEGARGPVLGLRGQRGGGVGHSHQPRIPASGTLDGRWYGGGGNRTS